MFTLHHSIKRTHGFENLKLEGKIPDQLKGTLYRVGPGLIERFGHTVHPFLADGAITAIQLGNNPKGACQIVKSEKYLQEELRGRSLYDTNAPFYHRIYNGITRNIKNTGNTNVLSWQGKLFALMEQGKPVEFQANDLKTVATNDLGIIKGSFSAHPHRVESLKTTFNFGINGKYIEVFALPDKGKIQIISRIKAPWASLIHDFIMTDKHIIFFIDPGKLVIWRAILGLKDFSKYFHWDENESTVIIIIPLNNPEQQYRLEVEPFRVWHFANAYEEGETIIVDAFRHKNIDVLTKPTHKDSDIPIPELYRFYIKPKENKFSSEAMWHEPCEFPIVNPQFIGAKHRYIWMQTYQDKNGNEGFAQFDTKTQQQRRWYAPDNHLVSEAIFIPRENREDDGWILQLIQDATIKKSYLAVFDSNNIEDEPVAKLWFDHGIPATFHGVFVPD